MMKKLILGAAVLACGFASAQIEWRETRFGLLAGPDLSGVSNAHNPSSKRWGLIAGGFAEIPLNIGGSTDQFYLQPEVMYEMAGENGDKNDVKRQYHADYLSVPVWFKGYFSESESEFFGMIGPRFGFLLNQKVVNPIGGREFYAGEKGKAASFDFAVAAGLGYSYKRQWELSVRYELGLSNSYPKLNYDYYPSGDPNALKKKSQQMVSLALSYTFDNNR